MICIAGKNTISVRSLMFLIEEQQISKQELCVCVNSNDSGTHTWQPSLKKYAENIGVSIKDINELYEIENLVFISLEFDRIIKPHKFRTSLLYNIHFSKLPQYKGMYTSIWPILNGDQELAVTLHYIDAGIDTGDIIDQHTFSLSFTENSYDLYEKFTCNAFELFKKNIDLMINMNEVGKPQSYINSSYYSSKTIDFKNVQICFNRTAFNVQNQIRAFNFRPYQLPVVDGYNISHTKVCNERSAKKPGTRIFTDNNSILVSTIDYDIILFKDKLSEILTATKEDNIELIEYFYRKGYHFEEKNENGWTPLIVASYYESIEVFNFLLNNNANVNVENNNGTSVLMYALTSASASGNLYLIKSLIAAGANVNHKDLKGISVMDYSNRYENQEVINIIKKAKFKIKR